MAVQYKSLTLTVICLSKFYKPNPAKYLAIINAWMYVSGWVGWGLEYGN